MAYGDITNSPNAYRSPSKPGVQTVRKAVLLKDGSTIGSAAVNYLSDTKTLEQLTSSGTASTTATKATFRPSSNLAYAADTTRLIRSSRLRPHPSSLRPTRDFMKKSSSAYSPTARPTPA